MHFHEKIKRRVAELSKSGFNKSKASEAADLPPSAISSYLAKPQSIPRADIAQKLARAINVPLDWLVDDAQDWPPPEPKSDGPAMLSDSALLRELLHRRRLAQIDLAEKLELAEQVDWPAVRKRLAAITPGGSIPREIHNAATVLAHAVYAAFIRLQSFDLRAIEQQSPQQLPDAGRPAEELNQDALADRVRRLWDNPDYQAARDDIEARPRSKDDDMRDMMIRWTAEHAGRFDLPPSFSLPAKERIRPRKT